MTTPEQIPQAGGTWLRLPDGSLQRVPEAHEVAAPEPAADAAKKKPAAPVSQE
jgi:hypothetical protein